ncbi:MAG: acyl-CoA thioesterase [Acidobacteriia bacterium]|nr:acyl-CoA thioesterase [Terriglobia bacterium]
MEKAYRPFDTSVTQTLNFSTDPLLRRRFLLLSQQVKANFRFGLLLEALDKLAENTALAYVRRFSPEARVVTAAIDNIRVRCAPDISRDMVLWARLNYVGRTSMEVGVRVEQPGDSPSHIASCYFTMVARTGVGDSARSVPLPPLEYEDDLEKTRAAKAVQRREDYQRSRNAAQTLPSQQEYSMLAGLHAAQEQPDFSGLLAAQLTNSGWERTYPEHENVPSKIFGGHVMHRAFIYAIMCAEMVSPDRPVIVSVNRINFHHPVRMGDKLNFVSRVAYCGRTSVCVETDIIRISLDRTTTALCNTCVFTFVNVDPDLRPKPVPPIYPTTYAEDARYLAAYRRHMADRGEVIA